MTDNAIDKERAALTADKTGGAGEPPETVQRRAELMAHAIQTLAPLAAIADLYAPQEDDSFQIFADCDLPEIRSLTLGQCRDAKALLLTGPREFPASPPPTAAPAGVREALEVIQNLRHKIAATFTPECSGQRGQDKCDVLYEAYRAVEALATTPLEGGEEALGYTELFNAIAAAVNGIAEKHVGISVRKFEEAIGGKIARISTAPIGGK